MLNRNHALSKILAILIASAVTVASVVGLYLQTGYVRVTPVDWGSTTSVDWSTISPQTANILGSIHTSFQPTALAYDPNNGMIYVSTSNGSEGVIDVISDSTKSVTSTIRFPMPDPSVLVFDNTYNNLYAYDSSEGKSIYVINPNTNEIISNMSLGVSAKIGNAVFVPINQELYVAGGATNSLIIVSTQTGKVVETLTIKGNPTFVSYAQNSGFVYVETENSISGSREPGVITIINPLALIPAIANTIVSTIRLPATGAGMIYDPDAQNIFVVTNYPAAISIMNSQTTGFASSVFFTFDFDSGTIPGMAYDQVIQRFLLLTYNGSLIEFDPATNTVTGVLQLSAVNGAISVNTLSGNIYAISQSTNELLEFSP